MKNTFLLVVFFLANNLLAQTMEPERVLDFTVEVNDDVYEFKPIMPPLVQKPGAPKAYWSYFWEFGDGGFSREEHPSHLYTKQGDFMASLDATAHYDDGKKARKKNKPLGPKAPASRLTGIQPPGEDAFDPNGKQMVAMYSYSKPKAEEEITFVVSYRNLGAVATDGRLHLFFNEKKYPGAHFSFVETRAHFGELTDNSTSFVLPIDPTDMMDWAALLAPSSGGSSVTHSGDFPSSVIIQEMLNSARGAYREEIAWRFNELQPGEKRNLFVSLKGTAGMLRDTNAFIHLETVFAPFDPVVAPEKFVYDIEIVSSHDPNAIAVSDNRVNYRILGSKKLDYKIQFQNNGEGPASTVKVLVEVPNGLKMGAMRPVEWYPKCPICPKEPGTQGCLDTASFEGGLAFTFRNIYLPGTRQEGVEDRDSTKGFVKYRIEAARSMPKLPFRSRAKIVFDKNPPIYTNYTKTGFQVGKSPGLKAGYVFEPNPSVSAGESGTGTENSYFFIGASVSPYKSWRFYPQVELLGGIKARADLPDQRTTVLVAILPNPGIQQTDSILVDTLVRAQRGFVSFELPVLIRKNFSRYFGAGIGASARVMFENGVTKVESYRTRIDWEFMDGSTGFILTKKLDQGPTETTTKNFHDQQFRFALFGDLTFGSVRAGPNLGLRGGVVLGEKGRSSLFAQVSLELKL